MEAVTVSRCDAVASGRVGIVCRYHGPTNSRGSRISVGRAAGPGRIYVSWDHALNVEENYVAAVREYVERMDWDGVWCVGLIDNGGAVAVRLPRI